jgi:hypothetical protein
MLIPLQIKKSLCLLFGGSQGETLRVNTCVCDSVVLGRITMAKPYDNPGYLPLFNPTKCRKPYIPHAWRSELLHVTLKRVLRANDAASSGETQLPRMSLSSLYLWCISGPPSSDLLHPALDGCRLQRFRSQEHHCYRPHRMSRVLAIVTGPHEEYGMS